MRHIGVGPGVVLRWFRKGLPMDRQKVSRTEMKLDIRYLELRSSSYKRTPCQWESRCRTGSKQSSLQHGNHAASEISQFISNRLNIGLMHTAN